MHTATPFKERTPLAAARERVTGRVQPHDRTETVGLTEAAGRVLAEPATANRAVPHYERAAMDGYAVQAADTFGAGDRSPAVLRVASGPDDGGPDDGGPTTVRSGEAAAVHTGSELPDGADAVVKVEQVETVGDDLEVFTAVARGENVSPVGEDVEAGEPLYDAGHRLRPPDLGLLKSVGRHEVRVRERPTVAVVPTGEELVAADPEPGQVVETNALTTTRYVEAWGGAATYRDVVTDDAPALRAAVERDTDHDLVVTTGGSSVGERDLVPEAVADLGEVLVHGIGIEPGHPAGAGVVDDTPVLMLPGYPVSCIVAAVQLLRPVLKRAGGMPRPAFPTTAARLAEKVESGPGVRSFVRVRLEAPDDGADGEDDESPDLVATRCRASGASVLSSVGMADGWVVVPEEREGVAAGTTVAVENWEWSA